LADLNFLKAEYLRLRLDSLDGVEVKRSSPTYNEFTVCLDQEAEGVVEKMVEKGFAAGFPLCRYYEGMEKYMIIAVTEKRTKEEMDRYVSCLGDVLK